jgi:hypothetical protein
VRYRIVKRKFEFCFGRKVLYVPEKKRFISWIPINDPSVCGYNTPETALVVINEEREWDNLEPFEVVWDSKLTIKVRKLV